MHAQSITDIISLGGSESRDHKGDNTMQKVHTRKGFDYIKSSMLNHYVKSGYVLALA
jgi:hypothetical protein